MKDLNVVLWKYSSLNFLTILSKYFIPLCSKKHFENSIETFGTKI